MATVQELEEQLAEAKQEELAAETQAADKPILEQLKDVVNTDEGGVDPPFITKLRTVAGRLVEQGKVVEQDLVNPNEAPQVVATLIRVVGELVTKL